MKIKALSKPTREEMLSDDIDEVMDIPRKLACEKLAKETNEKTDNTK